MEISYDDPTEPQRSAMKAYQSSWRCTTMVISTRISTRGGTALLWVRREPTSRRKNRPDCRPVKKMSEDGYFLSCQSILTSLLSFLKWHIPSAWISCEGDDFICRARARDLMYLGVFTRLASRFRLMRHVIYVWPDASINYITALIPWWGWRAVQKKYWPGIDLVRKLHSIIRLPARSCPWMSQCLRRLWPMDL